MTRPGIEDLASDLGVLDEVEAVVAALQKHHIAFRVGSLCALSGLQGILASSMEVIIFNLVEKLEGSVWDPCWVPALCRAFHKRFTGSDSLALALTLDKWKTRACLLQANLPVPEAIWFQPGTPPFSPPFPGPYIVKPALSDASEGIHASSVFQETGSSLFQKIKELHVIYQQPVILERFHGTREINVSLLDLDGQVQVLPPAEIDFSSFPRHMPKIVDYHAKWKPESFEYLHTPRILPAPLTSQQLEEAQRIAMLAWQVTGCSSYARVDMRWDDQTGFAVLEVNANPDLSRDAGFAAAAQAAGIAFEDLILAILKGSIPQEKKPAYSFPLRGESDMKKENLSPVRRSTSEDKEIILSVLRDTGYFRPGELSVATEVLESSLTDPETSGYHSLTACRADCPVGWICFGPTPCSVHTFDIYWIAVARTQQRMGIGSLLLKSCEQRIREMGGRLLLIETSGHESYQSTRLFYEANDYLAIATIPDFYDQDDPRVTFMKRLDLPIPPLSE